MSNSSCPLLESETNRGFIAKFTLASFFWFRPLTLFAGLIGHILCILAFAKQSQKQEGAIYKFQVYEALAKTGATIGSLVDTFVIIALRSSGNSGKSWYEGSYSLMWMVAHVAAFLHDLTTSMAMFVSLCISLDRTYAIAKPMKYKNLNRKKWETTAVGSSILISVLICAYQPFLWNLVIDEEIQMYKVELNEGFAKWSNAWSNLRSIVWVGGVIGIMLTGAHLVLVYKKNNRTVATLTQSYDKEKQQKKAERTLFILAVYDGVQAVTEISLLITHTILGLVPGFIECEGELFFAVRVIVIGIVNGSDFYVMLLASKQFRKVIKEAIGLQT